LRSSVPWAQRLDDAFFDFVFFGRGSAKAVASRLGLDPDVIEGLRREFTYWYPVDLRNTGKDLVQNHMTFCLFAHTAIFPKEQWPRGFGVNGWVRLAGRKMSKSRGNVWYIREAVREWGADVIRLTVANAGDGLDDPNVDMDFAESAKARIEEWLRFATSKHGTRKDHHGIDAWFLSVLSRSIQASRTAMEGMNYKAALRHGYFDLQAAWSWYVRRSEATRTVHSARLESARPPDRARPRQERTDPDERAHGASPRGTGDARTGERGRDVRQESRGGPATRQTG